MCWVRRAASRRGSTPQAMCGVLPLLWVFPRWTNQLMYRVLPRQRAAPRFAPRLISYQ